MDVWSKKDSKNSILLRTRVHYKYFLCGGVTMTMMGGETQKLDKTMKSMADEDGSERSNQSKSGAKAASSSNIDTCL